MFENFISLGGDCHIAAALSKHGLRSASGPFDWCTSSFEGVLRLLENDFIDFLDYQNLRVDMGLPKCFDDTKYHINYNHEIKDSLENDYTEIKEKYQRRIERFRIMTQEPTCFVRGIRLVRELLELVGAEERIFNAIKREQGNEIIFVVPRYIYEQSPIESGFKIFLVDDFVSGFDLGREESRSFFDSNPELLDYCINNYRTEKRKDNLIFDLKHELSVEREKNVNTAAEKEICRLKKQIVKHSTINLQLNMRLAKWEKVVNTDYASIDYSGKIAIYGCGAIGRTLYNYMKREFDVIEFIDRNPRQDWYDGVPVNTIEGSISDENTLIIIVPTYDYDIIELQLKNGLGFSPQIQSMEIFLAEAKILDPNF